MDEPAKEILLVKKPKQNNKTTVDRDKDIVDKPAKKEGSAWKGAWTKIRLLWPFMWPKGQFALQVRVVACVLILAATRGITVLVPIYYKKIVDSLTIQTIPISSNGSEASESLLSNNTLFTLTTPSSLVKVEAVEFRWDYILIFILLKAMHGGSGYLNCLRSFLWIRVSQSTRKKMRLQLFSHLHSLSIRWHLNRKTGEVLRVMDRGVNSINLILSHVLFQIIPVVADIIIAIVFFITVFNVWTGLIVFLTMVGYLVFTIVLTEWRTKFRRKMNDADNERNASSVDSILNFETVKYYSAEDWEVQCYEDSVDRHLRAEWLVNTTANFLNVIQKTMMMLGLLGGSLFCAWYVYEGKFTVGDYVLFGAYVEQLYGPLNMFGMYYRTLQQAFVDMENMFEMMYEKEDIVDATDAKELVVSKGHIEFDNVTFHYTPEKPLIRNVSFSVPPGQTYALVGHSGGGKSTIIRLLFRFYDIQEGQIRIDGDDISKVTQKSLRKQVGVVPQDTVLFNRNIRYNIRYGRVDADDDEVEDAATAADIHGRIVAFPSGYDSKVGERGLKLSGGEKQRIAIARTILKGPKVVLLDEATSALDTRTERNIQSSLSRMCENRTTIIVAHRLSTIVHADQILVIEEGEIVERGTHAELLTTEGHYYGMWKEQLQSGEVGGDDDACKCCNHLDNSDSEGAVVDCNCSCHIENKLKQEFSKSLQTVNTVGKDSANRKSENKPLDSTYNDSLDHTEIDTARISPESNTTSKMKGTSSGDDCCNHDNSAYTPQVLTNDTCVNIETPNGTANKQKQDVSVNVEDV